MFYPMSLEYVKQHKDDLLCQYSDRSSALLYNPAFEPESFTALEKMQGNDTLFFAELSFEEWIGNMLKEQFICGGVGAAFLDDAISCGIKSFKNLLMVCGEKDKIYNQEVVDVLRRITVYTITGQLGNNIDTARVFNDFSRRIMPSVIQKTISQNLSIQELLKLSIVSGLSGLDLKGATAAASSHSNIGIPMSDLMQYDPEQAAKAFFERLLSEYRTREFPLFHFDEFIQHLIGKKGFKLVWMTDDYIESYFDLLLVERLLSAYDISITLIPKNGRFGNDASYDDICGMISPIIKEYQLKGKLRILNTGPMMAAANLRKLSFEHVSSILFSDAVLIKGCRISEMLNGGINAHTYVAYNIVRKVSEKIAGFSAEKHPSVFFHLGPGEYAFWGVKGCKEVFDAGHALSTVKNHFEKIPSPEKAVEKFNSVRKIADVYKGDKRPLYQELSAITDKIVMLTAHSYNIAALRYSSLGRREYPEFERQKWNRLITVMKKQYDHYERIKLLDVGAGDGKGIQYAHSIGLNAWGCDISDTYVELSYKQLPEAIYDRVIKCDMRSLCFEDESFHVVRLNAALVHMPLIAPGYGADKVFSEARRVLLPGGLLYVSVKIGNSDGIICLGTDIDVGKRVYQFYRKSDVKYLLSRNGFLILDVEDICERKSSTEEIKWYNIVAKKA